MKLFKLFKKGQKGVTLVELMVVMAVLAVLASIIFPAVSGTQEVSVDSQTKQDASTVSNAINDFFADQVGAEVRSSSPITILTTEGGTANQTISSRWPEEYITDAYDNVFTTSNVTSITISNKDGAAIEGTVAGFVTQRTAINFYKVGSDEDATVFFPGYVPAIPKSFGDMSVTGSGLELNNYLWLALKTTAAGGVSGGSRQLEIYKLTGVVDSGSDHYDLTYRQIY